MGDETNPANKVKSAAIIQNDQFTFKIDTSAYKDLTNGVTMFKLVTKTMIEGPSATHHSKYCVNFASVWLTKDIFNCLGTPLA